MTGKIGLLLGVVAVVIFQVQGERLIWSDEFDSLDLKNWTHLVSGWDGGNGEFQYYRNNRKNSFAKDGKLFIRPTLTNEEIPDLAHGTINEKDCNRDPCSITGGYDIIPPYFSARINSKNFAMKYGRVEISAKMPTGDWLWPAIWMYPAHEKYGGWPRSGEIDIVEVRGNPDLKGADGVNHGITEVGSALHFGPYWDYKASLVKTVQAAPGKSWADGFHKYEFIWSKDQMKFVIDGKVLQDIRIPAEGITKVGNINTDIYKGGEKNAPFDNEFFFIFNVAVGGGFFPDSWKSSGRARPWKGGDNRRQIWNSRNAWEKTWGSPDQHSMQVDYIRVYQ